MLAKKKKCVIFFLFCFVLFCFFLFLSFLLLYDFDELWLERLNSAVELSLYDVG